MLVPSETPAVAACAEERGARFMDVRVTLERQAWPGTPYARPGVRGATSDDAAALEQIARTAFRGRTRFYADPRLPDARCDDLYANWLRESLAVGGRAEIVMVADDEQGPAGFVTVELRDRVASIGLIAVAQRARGQHVGRLLCAAVVEQMTTAAGADRLAVVTQGQNIAAQRTFQRAGFRASRVDLWFHWWYGRP